METRILTLPICGAWQQRPWWARYVRRAGFAGVDGSSDRASLRLTGELVRG